MQRMAEHLTSANRTLQTVFEAEPLEVEETVLKLAGCAEFLQPYIAEVGDEISQALKNGRRVLAEGAQGTLLDLDHGTYPFVTSSNPIAPGAFAGLGLGITPVERVIGVTKVFQTRVGAGPFPTEVFEGEAERLRGTGANPWDEFGTTTGRPRRVGWLDLVLLRYAARVNGLTELILTKLDVLSGLPELRLCSAYQAGGRTYERLPFGPADLSPFEPIYEVLPGWSEDVSSIRRWVDLPVNARRYVNRIAELTGVPVSQVSVGPERDQVVDVVG
jgi:adenylosuccinate synthase